MARVAYQSAERPLNSLVGYWEEKIGVWEEGYNLLIPLEIEREETLSKDLSLS